MNPNGAAASAPTCACDVGFAPACLWLDERRPLRFLGDERRRRSSGGKRIGGIAVDQHLGHGAIDDNHHLASTERRLAQALRGDAGHKPRFELSSCAPIRSSVRCLSRVVLSPRGAVIDRLIFVLLIAP